MPAVTNIVINDGLTVPVAHTFGPAGITKEEVAEFNDRVTGVGIGFGRLSVSLRRPLLPVKPGTNSSSVDRVYKAMVMIDVPTLEVTSPTTSTGIQPAPTVAYSHRVTMTFLLPERGTLANRKDIIAYAKNILANATVNTVLENLEQIY